jgi:hypothetical protein
VRRAGVRLVREARGPSRADLETTVTVLARLVWHEFPPYSLAEIAETWSGRTTDGEVTAVAMVEQALQLKR